MFEEFISPIFLGIIFPTFIWYLKSRHQINSEIAMKNRNDRVEVLRKKQQILWNLFSALNRHKHLYNKYVAIKQGRISIDTSADHSPNSGNQNQNIINRNVERENGDVDNSANDSRESSDHIHINVDHSVHIYPEMVNDDTSDTLAKERFARAVNFLQDYLEIAKEYDRLIKDNFDKIREFINNNIDIIEPDHETMNAFFKLDRFISLYESFRKVGDDDSLPTPEQGGEFPDNIYQLLENMLISTREEYHAYIGQDSKTISHQLNRPDPSDRQDSSCTRFMNCIIGGGAPH